MGFKENLITTWNFLKNTTEKRYEILQNMVNFMFELFSNIIAVIVTTVLFGITLVNAYSQLPWKLWITLLLDSFKIAVIPFYFMLCGKFLEDIYRFLVFEERKLNLDTEGFVVKDVHLVEWNEKKYYNYVNTKEAKAIPCSGGYQVDQVATPLEEDDYD